MRQRSHPLTAVLAGLACVLLVASCAGRGSSSPEAPLAGETLEVVLGSSPGGGFDTYLRAVQPFLEDELDATIEIRHEPGAGGLLAWNEVAGADPDGATIAFAQVGPTVMNLIAGQDEGIEFDLSELTYLGDLAGPQWVFYAGASSGFHSLDDVLRGDRPFNAGAPAPATSAYIFWSLMVDEFGVQGSLDDVVTGFDGTDELFLAATRGDIAGSMSPSTSAASRIAAGDLVPLAMIDHKRAELLPDVPTIFESGLTPEQESAMNAFIDATALTRLFVGPPGMDENVTRAWRTALQNVATNPEFLRRAADLQLPIDFTDGETARDRLLNVLDNPPAEFRSTLVRALEPA